MFCLRQVWPEADCFSHSGLKADAADSDLRVAGEWTVNRPAMSVDKDEFAKARPSGERRRKLHTSPCDIPCATISIKLPEA